MFLTVNNVDAVLGGGDLAAGEVVNGLTIEHWTLTIEDWLWGPYSGGVWGGEGFYGDALELEGIDAKAGLACEVDNDA